VLYCQGKLEDIEQAFDKMVKEQLQYPKVGMVCLAMVKTQFDDGSDEDVCLRARIENITDNNASVQSLLLPVYYL